jgi:hypothetical protein
VQTAFCRDSRSRRPPLQPTHLASRDGTQGPCEIPLSHSCRARIQAELPQSPNVGFLYDIFPFSNRPPF